MNFFNPLSRRPLHIVQILLVIAAGCSLATAQSYIDAAKSAEIDQSRIERARALMAAHQLDTAASELEAVRASTKETALRNVSSVMLMNVYLEEGNYTRAQALLEESFGNDANRNEESLRAYFAVAGQAVNGARSHLARYRNFGINISDANLPAEAAKDLDHLRSFLERMVAQAKTISDNRRAYDSLSLLEDVIGLRVSVAKDTDDQTRWSSEYASVRETLASSQTQVASLSGGPVLPVKVSATSKTPAQSTIAETVLSDAPVVVASSASTATEKVEQPVSGPNPDATNTVPAPTAKPIDMGALNGIATRRVVPTYPAVAKQMGMKGMVRVYVVFDENGRVVDIPKSDGPAILRGAAELAARQWVFQSTPTNGKPLRMSGFIDFNFTL